MIPAYSGMLGTLLTLIISGILIYKIVKRQWDMLSFNTIFLLGFMQFHCFAVMAFWLFMGDEAFPNHTPTEASWNFMTTMMIPFIVAYLVAYRVARNFTWMQKIIPPIELPVSYSGMLVVLAVMVAGILLTTLAGFANLLEFFVIMVRPAFCGFAVGLAVVLVCRQPANPLFWIVLAATFLFGVVISTTFQSGRRDALGIFFSALWMAYWSWLRYRPLKKQVGVVAIGGTAALMFLFAYSNMRGLLSPEESTLGARANQLSDIASGKVNPLESKNTKAVIFQDACLYTCYVMEEYPRTHPLVPFNGLAFFITNPIPRVIYENKPVAMGIQVQKHLNAGGNLGIGIIGHGWAEGLYIGMIAYAVFFGVVYRVMDTAIKQRAYNPYFLAAMGTGLGHMLALPRGEVSLFAVLWFYGFLSIVFLMWVVKAVLGNFMAAAGFFEWGTDQYGQPGEYEAKKKRLEQGIDEEEQGDYAEDESYGDESFVEQRRGELGGV
jgi:hypothetical protein